MTDYYKLVGKKAVPCDASELNEVFKIGNRRVEDTKIDGIRISTVFLGIDHSYDGGPPLLFETMVFGGELDQSCWRCETYEDAEEMHKDVCRKVLFNILEVDDDSNTET